MLLFLMGASTGAAYAVANPGVADVKITQMCIRDRLSSHLKSIKKQI